MHELNLQTVSLPAALFIGWVLGLRHALDADHMVAVSTLVARERSLWRATRIGAVWGLGHTATLLVMGILIVVLGLRLPEFLAPWLRLAVAAMLIALGVRTLWQWRRGEGHLCLHQHEGHSHAHFHRHGEHACAQDDENDIENAPPKSAKTLFAGRQSFWVGAVHGLSGSAELMLLVLATIRQPWWALAYIAVFGAGMMTAMFAITGLFSGALHWTQQRGGNWTRIDNALRGATGIASLGFGAWLLIGIARDIW